MVGDKLIYILPLVTFIIFIITFYKSGTSQVYLLFVLYTLPLMDLKVVPEAWGGFKTFDFISFFCFFFLFKDFVTISSRNKYPHYFLLVVCLIFIILIGSLSSEFSENWLLKLFKILPIFIYPRFLIKECIKDLSFHSKVVKAMKFSYVISLLFLVIQIFVGLKFTWYSNLNPNTYNPLTNQIRFSGIFYDPQINGQYLAIGSFLFLFTQEQMSRKGIILNYLIFIMAIVAINFTGSRSAFGGFCIGLLVAFFLAGKRYRQYALWLMFLGFSIFMTFSLRSGVFNRLDKISDDYLFRKFIWQEAYEISKSHPYLGIGIGNYQNHIMRYNQDQYLEINDEILYFDQPENGYLKILVELGFFGFGIFGFLILIPTYSGLKLLIEGSVDHKISFMIGALFCWLVAFNTVYSLFDSRIIIMVTAILALIITYPEKRKT